MGTKRKQGRAGKATKGHTDLQYEKESHTDSFKQTKFIIEILLCDECC